MLSKKKLILNLIKAKRKRSNIPNGKELCIRQNDIIKNKCIYNENVVT